MQAFLKLIYKDALVMVRDRGGLAMLFIMPLALVLIMTSLQDTTFRSINESGIRLLLLNNDIDSLGLSVEKEMMKSSLFRIYTDIDNKKPTEQEVKEAVAVGKFQIGVIIPSGATRHIRDKVSRNVEMALSGRQPVPERKDSVFLLVYLDPTTKTSFREILQRSIREFTSEIESRLILQEITREINEVLAVPVPDLSLVQEEAVFYREEYATLDDSGTIPNSVQHNVPAWTVFAMFFIVIPFAGAMIREREDGSLDRLLTMPASYAKILLSKILVFLVICYLQFVLILLMGIYFFPVVNLPALQTGSNLGMLSLMTLATAFAAIGYGIAVGTITRTHQQASIFASISVVILAALGGVWVPVFIMPAFLRQMSIVSPLNWALNGFYDILIRDAAFSGILPGFISLCLFSLACLALALGYKRIKRDS
ncbi:MAG: ABC transporter permease [Bacteroidales bacterium]|nr:ABC transporter permease [Bacteroidales bacterium]